ncbi:hypothetical protein [Halomonas caseinilytica]|uniref:hypothetical protein n=1 Tax=Halomonas caseinilytica TaxID=438744 RepID=UPI000848E705|nr:hypothetical protein [Halomonas caseinilytica]
MNTVLPTWLISEAAAYWHFWVLGLFDGRASGSSTMDIAYIACQFSKVRQGLAMRIFGTGNAGAAITKCVTPSLVVASIDTSYQLSANALLK